MKSKQPDPLEVVKMCSRVLDDKKAEDIVVLDVSAQSSITDYLVLATATSEPHLRALRVELEKVFDHAHVHLVGMEAPQESGWIVIDAFEVMVHLFLAPMRERYGLERLWQDAAAIPVAKLLQPEAKPKTRRAAAPRARKKKPTKKR